MDKITISLQDKETIKELAKDPDVQIKIKNAVLDGIGKRALKIANLSDEIISIMETDIRNYFTEDAKRSFLINSKVLKPEFKELIHEEANKAFYNIAEKELFEMHDWWEENTVSSAIALLKEQKETISAKEKAIEEYETVHPFTPSPASRRIAADEGRQYHRQRYHPLV